MYSKFSDFLSLSWRLVIRPCTIAPVRMAENYLPGLENIIKSQKKRAVNPRK
jgi:hypothetical protein